MRYFIYHILFWLLLFAGWHFFRYQDYSAATGIWITAIKVTDLALMVYITNYLLIPRLLYRKKYFAFGFLFLLIIISSSTFKMWLLGRLMDITDIFSIAGGLKSRIYDNVLPHILLVCTGAAFKLMLDQIRSQKKLAEMAKEKSEAELNFLKSQMNPHFLFNSLNAIYFLIDKENKDARHTLMQFSNLLRYQIYDCSGESVSIEKEIDFLKNYINLQMIRKDQQYKVSIDTDGVITGFNIPPLLLIPFVENAFKHISHSKECNFIDVRLSRLGNVLGFDVINSKDSQAKQTDPASGIGLNNVKRRLELLYPGRHDLSFHVTENSFRINLRLSIEALSK